MRFSFARMRAPLCCLLFCGAVLCCSLLLGGMVTSPAYADETTPEQALRDLQKALDTADAALLDKCVDVETVLGQAVDVFLRDIQSEDAKASLPPMLAMLLSPLSSSDTAKNAIRSTLQREASEFVRYGVRSGNFAGKPRETTPPAGLLAPAFADASLGRKELRSIGSTTRQGDVAVIPFSVLDHGNGNSYAVQAELHRKEGRWRIVGLANMPALVQQVRTEALK